MEQMGVWLAALLKPFLAVVFLGLLYFLGDWLIPRIEPYWPTWLGRRVLFKRYGDKKPQSP